LAVRYTVQKSRPNSKVKVKGQGHQGQKKTKKMQRWTMHGRAPQLGRTQDAATDDPIACRPG